ncbi:VRR-NUC domain-containing protein [Xenorhabdus sp. PB30.3]|uniref:VRR-NUC domain-containing protein n=1 Tax=Xenorhabdus sp. PB30.3 TaxID=2788941 RepID=UPI001E31ABC7|nr:VRR-NUC domain-containing protein [Xenorhabdus sp. PB30.3]MCC8379120.1 VRR-NUC domain-containing protein [Xenorhabdus sp. PB30.3]
MLRASEEWYSDYCARTKKKRQPIKGKKNLTTDASVRWDKLNNSVRSPHAVALERLSKKPELLKGNHEHYAQVRFFHHCEMNAPDIYKRLHSTPNGGLRHKKTGEHLRAEGQRKGYPDVSLDLARGCYHGMRLEFKHGANKPSEEQKQWLNTLSEDGFYCVVVYGEHEAIEVVMQYWCLAAGATLSAHKNDHLWKG